MWHSPRSRSNAAEFISLFRIVGYLTVISTSYLISSQDRSAAWLDRCLLSIVVLAGLFAMSYNQADADFWGHVQYGRDALRDGLPATNTYSYTAPEHRWINHENLSELLVAVGVEFPGPGGMLAGKSLLGLLLLVLVYRQGLRDGATRFTVYAVMLLMASNLMHAWSLRPHLLTYTLFALMIALLGWCFRDWPRPREGRAWRRAGTGEYEEQLVRASRQLRWMWLLVPLFAIWANTHGGFVAGYCMLAAYLSGRSVEALFAWGRRGVPLVGLFAAVVAVAALATLINPYGWELHRWLLHSLGSPRPEIYEWRPPELLSLVWPPFWIMCAVFVAAMIGTRRQRDWTHVALLCLTLWQACEHRRHIPFFAILFAFWMPVHVGSLVARFTRISHGDATLGLGLRARWGVVAAMMIAVGLLSYQLTRRWEQIHVRTDRYPVAAFEYLCEQDLSGRVVVQFDWAQYLIAAFGPPQPDRPQLQVAFDGRFRTCYPQEVVDMYFDFALGDAPHEPRFRSPNSPPVDGARILEYQQPNLVLIGRSMGQSIRLMRRHSDDWVLLYQDSLAQLWGRREIYDDPDHADYLPPDRRRLGNEPQQRIVAWPALPVGRTAGSRDPDPGRLRRQMLSQGDNNWSRGKLR